MAFEDSKEDKKPMKKKFILDIVGESIKKYGFKYETDPGFRASDLWTFTRKVGSITQWIQVQHHRSNPELWLQFKTDSYGEGAIPHLAIDLIPEERRPLNGWIYRTEDDFKKILEGFVSIIVEYGFSKLEELSIEEEVIPQAHMGRKLLASYSELSQRFINENNIYAEWSPSNIQKWLSLFNCKIKETKDDPYTEVQDMLVQIAAFLGEQIRKEFGGDWSQGWKEGTVLLERINSKQKPVCLPLVSVVEAWKKGDIELLKYEYAPLFEMVRKADGTVVSAIPRTIDEKAKTTILPLASRKK